MSIETNKTLNLIILCGITFFAGARGLYLLTNYRNVNLSSMIKFWEGGFSIHGGIILAGVVGVLYLGFNLREAIKFGDVVAPYLSLSISVARIGCFLRGCCFGRVTDLPWGIRYTRWSLAYTWQLNQGLSSSGADFSLPVHPTQLYESFLCLILFLYLIWVSKNPDYPGKIFFTWGIIYSSGRLLIDHFREGIGPPIVLSLTISQLLNLLLLFVSIFALFYSRRSRIKAIPQKG